MLFRDTLARRAAEQAKALTHQLCTHRLGDAAQAAALLRELDVFLQQQEALPEGSSRHVMRAIVKGVVHDSLPREQQAELSVFASRSGLLYVVHLLAS